MPTIILQARSTFWFEYPHNLPARWVYEGQPFEIDSADYPQYELMAVEILEGKMPTDKPKPFAERIVTKISEALGGGPSPKASEDSGKFPCSQCQAVFNAKKGLEIHLRNAHTKKPAKE